MKTQNMRQSKNIEDRRYDKYLPVYIRTGIPAGYRPAK